MSKLTFDEFIQKISEKLTEIEDLVFEGEVIGKMTSDYTKVKKGIFKYSLTIRELKQKEEKKNEQ